MTQRISSTDTSPQPARGFGRVVAVEILVSFFINIAFNLVFALLLFPRNAPVVLWGGRGMALDLLPSAFLPAFMMTFGITLSLRARLRRGARLPSVRRLLPLPNRLFLRAAVVGIGAVVIIVPPVLGLIAAAWTGAWTWADFVLFKLGFSALHAILVTPLVVTAALSPTRAEVVLPTEKRPLVRFP